MHTGRDPRGLQAALPDESGFGGPGEVEQVCALGLVQLQGAGEAFQDARRPPGGEELPDLCSLVVHAFHGMRTGTAEGGTAGTWKSSDSRECRIARLLEW